MSPGFDKVNFSLVLNRFGFDGWVESKESSSVLKTQVLRSVAVQIRSAKNLNGDFSNAGVGHRTSDGHRSFRLLITGKKLIIRWKFGEGYLT
ncbi:hypothetical protein BWI93_13995 [Siphonobacter sp. BAB-5385]|nr:hypothetical protein BWI93_13995 [Siphonobacter sp. BAB-5385]